MQELQSEFHRYKFSNIANLVKDIKEDMERCQEKNNLYTITLVKNDQLVNLPNVSIRKKQELDDFYNKYYQSQKFQEVWFLKKKNNQKQMFSIGRISFDTNQIVDNIDSQILEQIWNSSHRDITKYNEKYEKAYLRASRKDWAMRYKIEKLVVPKDKSLDKKQIEKHFVEAVKEIERKRENIEQFSEYLQKIGIYQFSLEYLLQEGKMLFIDWDSNNDLKVINNLFKEKR